MERIHSFDFLKCLSLFFVVIVHAQPFLGYGFLDKLGVAIMTLARFAVPCFFLMSGYILSKKFEDKNQKIYVSKYLKNLISDYGFATVLFLALNIVLVFFRLIGLKGLEKAIILNFTGVEGILSLVYFGDAFSYHLWFFPALIISVMIVYLFYEKGILDVLMPISFLLHLVGVASEAYNFVPLLAQPRDPLFFGLFFVAAGFYISEKNIAERIPDSKILILLVIAATLQVTEGVFISSHIPSVEISSLDYSLFTSLTAISIFMYMISRPELGKDSILQKYGRESLLIYIFHPVILFGIIASSEILYEVAGIALTESIAYHLLAAPFTFFLTSEIVLKYRKF